MIVEFYGGAKKAPGTYFVAEVKDTTGLKEVRLKRFVFSDTQSYIIEIGDKYMRFYKDNGQIAKYRTWVTGTAYIMGDYVKNTTYYYYCTTPHTAGTTFAGDSAYWTDTSWDDGFAYVVGDFVVNAGIMYYCITPHTSEATFDATELTHWVVQTIYEIPTDYTESQIWALQFAQKEDVLYITHPDHPQAELTRTGHTLWTLTDIDYSSSPAKPALMDMNITTTTITLANNTHPSVTIEASANIFDISSPSLHIGSIWKINSAKSVSAPDWEVTTAYTTANYVTFNDEIYFCVSNHTSGSAFEVDLAAGKWSLQDVYVKITSVTDANSAVGDILYGSRLEASPAATTNWQEGSWSAKRGYPKSVTLYEGRLVYGYTNYQPQTTWQSEIGAYKTFEKGVNDADATSFKADTNEVEVINWLFPANEILIGTVSGLHTLGTGSDTTAFTPTTARIKKKSRDGVSSVMPYQIGNYVYYWQKYNRILREYAYALDVDNFQTNDVTAFSEHISESGIVDMDLQQSPLSILWCVRADGKLVSFTRQIEQKVAGWAQHDTQGLYKSVAVIPKVSYDEVWFVIRRTIGGTLHKYIEYMTAPEYTDQEDAFFVHSGLLRDNLKTITNATKTNPVVVTCNNDFSEGSIIKIRGMISRLAGAIPEKTVDPMEYATDALAQAAYVSDAAGTVPTSEYSADSYDKLLLHFNNNYTDSATGKTVTNNGVTFSGSVYKFGSYSAYFSGVSDYLSLADHADWDLGTDDFTIDCWMNFATIPSPGADTIEIVSHWSGSIYPSVDGLWTFRWAGSTTCLRFSWHSTTAKVVNSSSWTPTINTWYHLACVRSSGVITFYINGVASGGGACADDLTLTPASTLQINNDPAGNQAFNGYMDELRIGKGIARWTSDFSYKLQCYSEASIKTQGDYSLKGIAKITDSLGKTLTRTIAVPLNWTDVQTLTFDIYALRIGSNIKIGFADSGGYVIEHTPDILISNEFQTETVDLSGVSNANKNAISSIIITMMDAAADNIFYIDNIFTVPVPAQTVGMTELNNNRYLVAPGVSGTSFHLHDLFGVDVDGTDFTPYDTGGEAIKCVNQVTGLTHLALQNVQVFADGAYHPDRTVSLAGVVTLDAYYAKVVVGLGYTARLKSNDLEGAPGGVTSQGRTKRVSAVSVNLYKSLDCKIGTLLKMDNLIVRDVALAADVITPLFTGIKRISFPSGWDTTKEVTIEQDKCLPLHVLSLVLDMEIN